jgi:hypothetical protein
VRSPRVPVALAVGSVGSTLHPCAGNAWRPHKTGKCPVSKQRVSISARGVLLPLLTVVRPLVYQSNSFHYCHSAGEACLDGLVHRRKSFPRLWVHLLFSIQTTMCPSRWRWLAGSCRVHELISVLIGSYHCPYQWVWGMGPLNSE